MGFERGKEFEAIVDGAFKAMTHAMFALSGSKGWRRDVWERRFDENVARFKEALVEAEAMGRSGDGGKRSG